MNPFVDSLDKAQWLDEMKRQIKRQNEIMDTLDPGLPMLTRVVMASDLRSAEDAFKAVVAGRLPAEKALTFAGSYARIKLLMQLQQAGFVPLSKALDLLPRLWSGSDPDDTDPAIIQWWRLARSRKGRLVTDENKGLPKGMKLTVYRGQRLADPLGCAWSLDPEIALKFAKGASLRVANMGGEVIALTVHRTMILAYITGRGEAEAIIDPSTIERTP